MNKQSNLVAIVSDVVGWRWSRGGALMMVLGLEGKQRVQRVRQTLTGRAAHRVVVVVLVMVVIVLVQPSRGVVGLRRAATWPGAVAQVQSFVARRAGCSAHAHGARVAVIPLL